MRSNTWAFIAAALVTAGLTASGQAQPQNSHATVAARTVLASAFDPYTLHLGPCPQGGPSGGEKCSKLLPRSHPLVG